MPRKRIAPRLVAAFSLLTICGGIPLSLLEAAELDQPAFSNELTLKMADNRVREGYAALESGDLDGALALFDGIDELVQSTWLSKYHAACAYARTGHEDEALERLRLMVDGGFDYPDRLEREPDLESLRGMPEYERLVERARSNYEAGTAGFARGLPDYGETGDAFETEEALTEWFKKQDRLHYLHRNVWTATELLMAKIDVQARYLAALKRIRAGDPDFDYGLERIRASTRLEGLSRPGWGVVADLVRNEVDSYARSSPPADALGEANFFAGMVLSLKYRHDDPRRVEAYEAASRYLDRVGKGDKYHGAAQALSLVNELLSPDADEGLVGRKLWRVIEAYPGNADIYSIISTRLNHDAARVLWPIPIEKPDIDGNDVSLGDYRGKVVLIDFWAITCIPCRKEIPNLVEVYDKYHAKGFEIVSICLDSTERTSLEDLRRFIGENGMKWRHIYDGLAWKTDLVRRYFIGSIPACFLVGPDGSLIASGRACRGENLVLNVEKALAAGGESAASTERH